METRSASGARQMDWDEFPHDGSVEEKLRFCLGYAVLAPSNHNSQPWSFELRGEVVGIRADRTRVLPVIDPSGRELVVSCGAALFNLRVAIEHFGMRPEVEILPEPADETLLARVCVGRWAEPRHETSLLFNAISERRTNRNTFESWSVPGEVLHELARCAAEEDAWLEPAHGPRKEAVAELIAEGDRFQHGDLEFRRELAAWTTSGRTARRDGIPGYDVGSADSPSVVGPYLVRTFDWSRLGRAAKDRQLALGSPLLAVLGTPHDDVRNWIAAGQALQHVLLGACVAGLQSSFLCQPVEVPHLRPRLREALATDGFPQLVLRIGYGPIAHATPRRRLDEVLVPVKRRSI